MKNSFLILSLILLTLSCSLNNQTNDNKLDTNKSSLNDTVRLTNNKNDKTLDKKILGIWTDGTTDNATLDIRKDSIFYVDQFQTYKYSVVNDTIQIYYSDWTYKGKVEYKKDTLIFSSEESVSKYWKFKK